MMIKKTFSNDREINEFFAKTPNCYLIKFIVLKTNDIEREFHVIYTTKHNMVGKEHLQRKQV